MLRDPSLWVHLGLLSFSSFKARGRKRTFLREVVFTRLDAQYRYQLDLQLIVLFVSNSPFSASNKTPSVI